MLSPCNEQRFCVVRNRVFQTFIGKENILFFFYQTFLITATIRNDLFIRYFKLNLTRFSVSYYCPMLHIQLPVILINSFTLPIFKSFISINDSNYKISTPWHRFICTVFNISM